jgi:hypothetical protein
MELWFSTTAAAAFDRSQCPVIHISFAIKHLPQKYYAAFLSGAELTNNCCVSHSEFRMGRVWKITIKKKFRVGSIRFWDPLD